MRELKKLDKVAYIRFASVYRSFEDIDEFKTLVDDGSNFSMTNAQQRTLCVSPSGRVRVVGDGTTSCSTATDR
jgi:hypothetical protein